MSRFARWQIASRLVAGPIALPFVNDTKLFVERGMTGATGSWYSGLGEPAEMCFVLHASRPDETFADIGANVGAYSIMAAGAVGARVLAVEPVPATFDSLELNIRLNLLESKIDAHRCGLSEKPGELRFTISHGCANHVARADDDGPTEIVQITTLDALCGARVPSIMKIDVEGHELAVLKGASSVLTSPRLQAVVMETNGSGAFYGVGDIELIDRMRVDGFAACQYDWERRLLFPSEAGSHNTIFARDPEALTAKCRSAPQFRLVNGMV
jgi:FkbM family methyltransferase